MSAGNQQERLELEMFKYRYIVEKLWKEKIARSILK